MTAAALTVEGQRSPVRMGLLLGVLGDDLVEADRVVHARLRVVQRGAGQPHVGADVRVGLGTARVIQPAQEAQLIAKRGQRLGRLAKHELPVLFRPREPAPLVNAMLRPRQRHAVSGVKRTKASRRLLGHFFAHRLEHGQRQRNTGDSFEHRTTIKLRGCGHRRYSLNRAVVRGAFSARLRLLFQKQLAVDDEPNQVLHAVAGGLQF